jgi:hypothetical protein
MPWWHVFMQHPAAALAAGCTFGFIMGAVLVLGLFIIELRQSS